MTRRVALVLPLAVLLLLGLEVTFLEAQLTPPWRVTLDRYLQTNKPMMSVQQVQRATLPSLLTLSYGQVVDYGAYCYQAESRGEGSQTCDLVLPYPPLDVYCVLVGDAHTYQLLLVSRFADNLWRDDWGIVAGPPAASFAAAVAMPTPIGCGFEPPAPL